MLPALKKLPTGDVKADKFQDYVSQQFELINCPFIRGKFITTTINNVETDILPLTTTATNYPHGLDREPIGFLVAYQDANASIWWDRSSSEDRDLFIRLDASATVNAKVWVF
jgi:hypothetical protein